MEIFWRIYTGLAALLASAICAISMVQGDWFWAGVMLALAALNAWLAVEEAWEGDSRVQYEVTVKDSGRLIIRVPDGEFARLGLVGWLAVQWQIMKMRLLMRWFTRTTRRIDDIAFLRRELRDLETGDGILSPVCAELVRRRIRQLEEGR